MATLRFVRDEKTNVVTFLLVGNKKVTRIVLPLNSMALCLMVGKEVDVKIASSDIEPIKKKGKKNK